MEGNLGKAVSMGERADVWRVGEMGIKKDQNNKNLGLKDNWDRDKIQKETKSCARGRWVLEMWSEVKELQISKVQFDNAQCGAHWRPRDEHKPRGPNFQTSRPLQGTITSIYARERM